MISELPTSDFCRTRTTSPERYCFSSSVRSALVMTITGIGLCRSFLNFSRNSKPFMIGMIRSRRMMSGAVSSYSSRVMACEPFSASRTSYPERDKASLTLSRIPGSSSTSITFLPSPSPIRFRIEPISRSRSRGLER